MATRRGGPGPSEYALPPTVGYEHHDFTRLRNPAYSMGNRTQMSNKNRGPGPQYDLGEYTRFGKSGIPAYSMGHTLKARAVFKTPGPGTYAPENVPPMKEQRAPAYSLGNRTRTRKLDSTPGPNVYTLPAYLGPKIPDKGASAAYTMGNRTQAIKGFQSPGPAQYGVPSMNVYKDKQPQFSMGGINRNIGNRSQNPGPAGYLPMYNTSKSPPKFSFGVRHSEYSPPLVTEQDNL